MVHGKDPALDDDEAHVQAQVLHGHGVPLEGLAVEGVALLRCRTAAGSGLLFGKFRLGTLGDQLGAHLLHGVKEGLALEV